MDETWEEARPGYFIMPVTARRPCCAHIDWPFPFLKGQSFPEFHRCATLARSARQPGRWISMGYAKYFVSPITSTSLTHCTPGITIVYTTVHAIGLPGGWHRQSETTFAADISIESPVACPSHKDKFFPSSSFSKKIGASSSTKSSKKSSKKWSRRDLDRGRIK